MIMRIVITIFLIIILLWIFWQDMKPPPINSRKVESIDVYDRAYSLRKKCKYREAIVLYNECVKKNPADWIALGDIGHSYYQIGKLERAFYFTNKALEINPECIEHLSLVAIIQSDLFADYKKAEKLLNSIELQLKSHDELWDNLKEILYMDRAWIYLKKGDTKTALDYFNKSVGKYFVGHLDEYDETFSSIHYRIATFYKIKGNLSAAKESFEKSIKSGGTECIFSQMSEKELKKMAQ